MSENRDKDVRQWQYEHGERKLPDAPWWLGNWSLAGLLFRTGKRRKDKLADAARRMSEEGGSDRGAS